MPTVTPPIFITATTTEAELPELWRQGFMSRRWE
jgi:hypothetical protein